MSTSRLQPTDTVNSLDLGLCRLIFYELIYSFAGFPADICGSVKVIVQIQLGLDFSHAVNVLTERATSLEILCPHDLRYVEVMQSGIIPRHGGLAIFPLSYDKMNSRDCVPVNMDAWIHIHGSSCDDSIEWAAMMSYDKVLDFSDNPVKITKMNVLKCVSMDYGAYFYNSITFEIRTDIMEFVENFPITCEIGLYILLMKIDDYDDLIISNNYVHLHLPVDCYLEQKSKIQDIQFSIENTSCYHLRHCYVDGGCIEENLVVNLSASVLHQHHILAANFNSKFEHISIVTTLPFGEIVITVSKSGVYTWPGMHEYR